jgi:transposase
VREQELNHRDGQAEKFYRDLKQRGIRVRVGMEATGYSRWFERLLAELGFELSIGDPAEIKAKRVKKQKFDREDARVSLIALKQEQNLPHSERTSLDAGLSAHRRIAEVDKREFRASEPFFHQPSACIARCPSMAIGHSLETFSTLCRQTHADDDGTSRSHGASPSAT